MQIYKCYSLQQIVKCIIDIDYSDYRSCTVTYHYSTCTTCRDHSAARKNTKNTCDSVFICHCCAGFNLIKRIPCLDDKLKLVRFIVFYLILCKHIILYRYSLHIMYIVYNIILFSGIKNSVLFYNVKFFYFEFINRIHCILICQYIEKYKIKYFRLTERFQYIINTILCDYNTLYKYLYYPF